MSERGPYAAGNTLFGLVSRVRPKDFSDKRKFLYQVSDKKTILQQIEADVVLAYYDPIRHAIGLGAATNSGISVRFVTLKTALNNAKRR